MIATLVSMKLRLVINGALASPWLLVALLLAASSAAVLAATGALLALGARSLSVETAAAALTLCGAALTLGWALAPVCMLGADQTVDPARLVTLPLSARRIVPGLLLAGLAGFPGLVTLVVAVATLGTWWRTPSSIFMAAAAIPVAVLTCGLACRLSTTMLADMLGSRRGRDLVAAGVVLAGGALAVLPIFFATLTPAGIADVWRQLAAVIGWTPLGLAWSAPGDAAAGHVWRGVVRMGLAVAVALAGAEVWARLIERQWARGASSEGAVRGVDRGSARHHPGAHAQPASPAHDVASAVAGRSRVYWRRDPRYLTLLVALPVICTAVLALSNVGRIPGFALALGPVVALTVALASAADLGYDGSAFAAHLSAGVSGRDDRAGRLLGTLGWSLPLVVVIAVLGALIARRPEAIPWVVGTSCAVLLGAAAAASLIGAVLPYPMPPPGAGPFRGSPGSGGIAFVSQTFVIMTGLATGLPVLLVAGAGTALWTPFGWLAVPAGLVFGGLAIALSVRWGGRVVDVRGPEILAAVRGSS